MVYGANGRTYAISALRSNRAWQHFATARIFLSVRKVIGDIERRVQLLDNNCQPARHRRPLLARRRR